MVVAFVILLSSGCNSARKEAALKQEISHLKPLIILYGQFYARRGSPPANQSQFREFIASHGQSILANIGVTNVDDLFVSERDGQPYVILYARSEPDDPSRDLVAYEQIGLNGKRYVGYSLGQIAELDEVQFRELVRE